MPYKCKSFTSLERSVFSASSSAYTCRYKIFVLGNQVLLEYLRLSFGHDREIIISHVIYVDVTEKWLSQNSEAVSLSSLTVV